MNVSGSDSVSIRNLTDAEITTINKAKTENAFKKGNVSAWFTLSDIKNPKDDEVTSFLISPSIWTLSLCKDLTLRQIVETISGITFVRRDHDDFHAVSGWARLRSDVYQDCDIDALYLKSKNSYLILMEFIVGTPQAGPSAGLCSGDIKTTVKQ